jgi:peroxiredoxin
MKTLYEKYQSKGYEMIALGGDRDVEILKAFQAKTNYPWLVGSSVLSEEQGLKDYGKHYGLYAEPTTFIIDRNGTAVFMQVGRDDKKLDAALEKLFAK